jgi:hypothetical protein
VALFWLVSAVMMLWSRYADAVKSVSVSTKYTLGRDLVDSIKVVYKKYSAWYRWLCS